MSHTGLVFWSIATYHCDDGYQLNGTNQRFCGSDELNGTNQRFCGSDELNGTNQRFCGSDGMWNARMPFCEKGKIKFYMV